MGEGVLITLDVKDSTIKYCHKILEKVNLGTRGNHTDGTPQQQLTGLVGEISLLKYLEKPMPVFKEYYVGYDVVLNDSKLDIKTMGRTVPMQSHFVHNLLALQKNNKSDGYIFCSLNVMDHRLDVCGYIFKDDFFKKASLFKEGQMRTRDNGTKFKIFSDLYEIKNEDIKEVSSRKQILGIKKRGADFTPLPLSISY